MSVDGRDEGERGVLMSVDGRDEGEREGGRERRRMSLMGEMREREKEGERGGG